MTFKQALDKEIDKNPHVGIYINICRTLQESGATRRDILKYFNKYMPKDQYDISEKKELIDYLVEISKPLP